MSNMSYCRFENTLRELQDCSENLQDTDLSDSEKRARERLVKLCREIADDFQEDEDEDEDEDDMDDSRDVHGDRNLERGGN
jgi:hypothetical protein